VRGLEKRDRLVSMQTPRGSPDAILRPTRAAHTISVERVPPSQALAGFVDYHWYVGWRTAEPYRQQVVPQPRVHLAAEPMHGEARLLVHGLSREPFFRTLTGEGHTLGAAFHPGGFRPFLRRSVGSVAGSVVPAGELLGLDDRPVAEQMLAMVREAEEDRGLNRAEDLAERASMSLRSLQRLFTEYVGAGPKWVVTRFRILDAAAAAHGGEPVQWAALAADLGFTDQAHLTRAFTAVVGTPPATYRREA
jgi:AraC-like DNA-binding protein